MRLLAQNLFSSFLWSTVPYFMIIKLSCGLKVFFVWLHNDRIFFQTLYTYPKNFRAYKALIAARYSGTDVKVDPDFKFGETNASANFIAKFPLGKVIIYIHIECSQYICNYVKDSDAVLQRICNCKIIKTSAFH